MRAIFPEDSPVVRLYTVHNYTLAGLKRLLSPASAKASGEKPEDRTAMRDIAIFRCSLLTGE
jgi:hypothetical protein